MTGYFKDRGAYFVCPTCEERFFVTEPDIYVYKMTITVAKDKQEKLFFNKYTCKLKYEAEYEKKKSKHRSDAAKKRHQEKKLKQNRIPKEKPELEEKCLDCQYCLGKNFGFYSCNYYDYPVSRYRGACCHFIEKVV